MIFDKLDNAEFYFENSPKIMAALDFIRSMDWKNLEPGKYEFNDDIFANLQVYTTKNPEDSEFEVHRKYFDIQYVIEGSENMGFSNLEHLEITKEYESERDVAFGDCKEFSYVTVKEGYFTFFAPNDAHKPCLMVNGVPEQARKIIVKIRI